MSDYNGRGRAKRSYLAWLDQPGQRGPYEALLKEEIFIGIRNRHIDGFHGIQLLRRSLPVLSRLGVYLFLNQPDGGPHAVFDL